MRGFCTWCLACWFALAVARAEPSVGLDELAGRLSALERIEALDQSVVRPLLLAKEALARARAAALRGDDLARARAEELAGAALELSEARLGLVRERALLKATAARRQLSERERVVAERALELERARVQALQKAEPAP